MSQTAEPSQALATAVASRTLAGARETGPGFVRRAERSVLAHRRHFDPMMVQSAFYPEDGPCHIFLLHPPGGLLDGERAFLFSKPSSGEGPNRHSEFVKHAGSLREAF